MIFYQCTLWPYGSFIATFSGTTHTSRNAQKDHWRPRGKSTQVSQYILDEAIAQGTLCGTGGIFRKNGKRQTWLKIDGEKL